MNKTISSPEGQAALHQSKLIPLGHKHSEAKKLAVRKWRDAVILMLAANRN